MGILARIFRPSAVKAAEGEYRDGPWHLPITGGWLPHEWGKYWNWWQLGHDVLPTGRTAIVQACIAAYAQTIAMCEGGHWRALANGGHERIKTSALSRILRQPNRYQSPSDFLLNLVSQLYAEGNAYALAIRNDRFEIDELHLMDARSSGFAVAEDGEVFYWLAGNEVVERRTGPLNGIPMRDVLHVRLETRRHPLRGESPLTAATLDLAASSAMAQQAIAFAARQSRPSGVLSTEQSLTLDQARDLRDLWNEQSRGLNAGGVPILGNGIKWNPMSATAQDSQIAELLKMSQENIALAYRVPLSILGIGNNSYASTEAMMQAWIATGLGFALNHVEQAFDLLFGLKGVPLEYTEFDTAPLLRSAFREQIEGLARGVQGGIYAPNEARMQMGLPAVEFGDEPRVQQQVVPLSFWGEDPPEGPEPPMEGPPDGRADFDRLCRQIDEREQHHWLS